MRLDLSDRVALVTGAGRGIGAAVARRLGDAGASVVLLDRDGKEAEAEAAKLRARGVEARGLAGDVGDPETARRAVAEATESFGGLHILVNNAAINFREKAFDVDLDHWDAVMRTNLRGYFLMAREAARPMVKARQGSIVNISSELSVVGLAEGQAAYSTSKAGVNQLTRVLAAEWAADNVRVNALAPGLTETPLVTELLKRPGYRERFEADIPLGRLATPEDVAHAALFLASDWAAFITGHTLMVDGGFTTIR